MNLLLFIIVLLTSFIVVRLGALAFQLTGLEWSLAKFQALSCFTGTGFTTRESELITANLQRRRIATILIVLGNAGLVTMIATFANTLRENPLVKQITLPFIHLKIQGSYVPWFNLFVVILLFGLGYMIFSMTKLSEVFSRFVRNSIVKKMMVKPVTFEELTIATGGYGVSQIEISEDSILVNKTLLDAHLRERDISVLALEKQGVTIPNPPPNTQFKVGDKIICFGKLENIRKILLTITNQ
ncbi:MAG: hypothetical protein GF384_08550 [Elusimicrobia bacterium]|nr:hypothetical protein [Elusimicrobiota bacterium]MBD3412667.1 hypothetical protein [Elusimicrobiota bacterium]